MKLASAGFGGRRFDITVSGVSVSLTGEIRGKPKLHIEPAGVAYRRRPFSRMPLDHAPGLEGLRVCIRAVVREFIGKRADGYVEWDFTWVKDPALRQRLFGIAGGLVRSIRMTLEERTELAMKGVRARYEREFEPFWREIRPGITIGLTASHREPRQWVVQWEINGERRPDKICRSRAQVVKEYEFAELMCEYAKLLLQEDRCEEREDADGRTGQ